MVIAFGSNMDFIRAFPVGGNAPDADCAEARHFRAGGCRALADPIRFRLTKKQWLVSKEKEWL